MLFPTGAIVATPAALRALAAAGKTPAEFLARHARGDWGDVCPEDARENMLSLARGFRLFSVYHYDLRDRDAGAHWDSKAGTAGLHSSASRLPVRGGNS
jgi:hypothetical protein